MRQRVLVFFLLNLLVTIPLSFGSVKEKHDFGKTKNEINVSDLSLHAHYLASEELEGRETGSTGAFLAADYVRSFFEYLGLQPFESASFLHYYNFISGANLGHQNEFSVLNGNEILDLNIDFIPLAFSQSGEFKNESVIFAGYGIIAPKTESFPAYNSYTNIDVKGKFVLIFRFIPEDLSQEYKQYLNQYAALHRKAMNARELGAKGLIIVSGPNSNVTHQLIPLKSDTSSASMSMFGISISDSAAEKIIAETNFSLKQIQDKLDHGEQFPSLNLTRKVSGVVDIKQEIKEASNVLAMLPCQTKTCAQSILLSAHIDHLGKKQDENGLESIFFGADDNASGSAAVMEIAQFLKDLVNQQRLNLNRNFVFSLWSGEELGTLGSTNFANKFEKENGFVYPKISCVLNMDMIGRLQDSLIVQAVGSSKFWPIVINKLKPESNLNIVEKEDPYLPTDSTVFYIKGVPTLNAFTGTHTDYHKPTDTPDKLNYEGISSIAKFISAIAVSVAEEMEPPDYQKITPPNNGGGTNKVYLGTIPDFSNATVKGVLLAGVKPESPAEKATLQAGDIIISLANQQIESIYDFQVVMSTLKIGVEVPIEIMRGSNKIQLKITPESKT